MKPQKLKRVCIKEELVALTGSYICALILNQFIYWSERTEDTDKFLQEEQTRNPDLDVELLHGWIFKKADQLASELMLDISAVTMRRYIARLVEQKLVNERKNPRQKQDQTLQYRPNIVEIQTQLQAIGYALEGYPLKPAPSTNLQNEVSPKPAPSTNLQNEDSTFKNDVSTFKNEFSTIYTEITPEIKHTDIERAEEKIEPEVIEKSAGVTVNEPVPDDHPSSLQDQLQTSRQPDDLSFDKGSEAAAVVITEPSRTPPMNEPNLGDGSAAAVTSLTTVQMNSDCARFEQRFQSRRQLPNYRQGWGVNDIDQRFLGWFCVRVIATWAHYKHRTPDIEDARSWVVNKENKGHQGIVENRFNQMQNELANPHAASVLNSQNIIKASQAQSDLQARSQRIAAAIADL